jgi:hypothetical protein
MAMMEKMAEMALLDPVEEMGATVRMEKTALLDLVE